MNARDKLKMVLQALPGHPSGRPVEAAVDELLNQHAHELAEKIRANVDMRGADLADAADAADFIDPEVTE